MNSIEDEDKLKSIIKYGKYIILLAIVVIILFALKSCKRGYNDIESEMILAAKQYITSNNMNITNQDFIPITKLGDIQGTELCSKASGVIVKNENGKINYLPYLKCDNYESTIQLKSTKYITLLGGDIVILNKGEVYEEKNYTLTRDADVVITGKVGTEPGVYTLSYKVYDGDLKETVYRTVIVTENDKGENVTPLKNREDPTLTLMGDKNIVLQVNQKYVEEGYTAIDFEDGKISRQVRVSPNPEKIDTKKPAIYTITYSVTNSKGNTAIDTRTITVVKYKADLDITLSKSTEEITREVKLSLDIKGKGYDRIIKPVSEISRHYEQTVRNNGKYSFTIQDIYGNKIIKEIDVNNIDNIPPSGTCSALVQGSNTVVDVSASDNKGIAGYSYILDGTATEYKKETNYKASQKSTTVSVKVKDLVGNETTLKCDVTIKEEPTVSGRPPGSSTVIDSTEYVLVAAKNDTVEFAKTVKRLRVAQNDPPGYPDMCLSFAYYHAYNLYNGDNINGMSAPEASKYMYAGRFHEFKNDDKQVVLEKVYELINAGQPMVIHVNGNKAGTSRHYVTVVGYKKSVTSGSTMSEQDLLIIDSYDGELERMDRDTSRFMISGYDTGRKTYGYQLYILK